MTGSLDQPFLVHKFSSYILYSRTAWLMQYQIESDIASYWQDHAKHGSAGIVFTRGPPHGQHVTPIKVKFGL